MYESTETKEQWLTELKRSLEDIKSEIINNPFGINKKEILKVIKW